MAGAEPWRCWPWAGWLAGMLAVASHCGAGFAQAPASPVQPWPLPAASPATDETFAASTSALDPARPYRLAELIDRAQRASPRTRVAWEKARQAAFAIGIAESEYLPQLSAEVLAGYQRTPVPIPAGLVREGYFTLDSRELLPALTVKWLLFDFGRRANADLAAREKSFVANVGFSGEHQRLVHAVSHAYFAAMAARGRRRAAAHALQTAATDLDAVQARQGKGLASRLELTRAGRQQAQAGFNATRAEGEEKRALADLLATIGLPPDTPLQLAEDDGNAPLPAAGGDIAKHLAQAFAQRPDLLASLGRLRAARAEVEQARAEHRPTVALAASVYRNIGAVSTDGSHYYDVAKPGGSLFLRIDWPLFDGGLRDGRIGLAQARADEAAAAVSEARDAAAREVAEAYYALETALAEHRAAAVLVEAAAVAHAAAAESYRQGVGSYVVLADAETAWVKARSELDEARYRALSAAAALAFATGRVSGPAPAPPSSP